MYPKLIEFDATGLFIDSRDTSVDAFAVGYTSDWIKNLVSVLLGNPTFVKAAIGSTKDILEKVEVEIKRLESLSLPSNGKSNFSTE